MNEYITEVIEIFTNYDVNYFDEYLLINKRKELSKQYDVESPDIKFSLKIDCDDNPFIVAIFNRKITQKEISEKIKEEKELKDEEEKEEIELYKMLKKKYGKKCNDKKYIKRYN